MYLITFIEVIKFDLSKILHLFYATLFKVITHQAKMQRENEWNRPVCTVDCDNHSLGQDKITSQKSTSLHLERHDSND